MYFLYILMNSIRIVININIHIYFKIIEYFTIEISNTNIKIKILIFEIIYFLKS